MICAINVGLLDEQASSIQREIAISLPYFGRRGPIKGIPLLRSYRFDTAWWGVLRFVIRRISTGFILCMIYVVGEGTYRVKRVVVVADRV